MKAIGGYFGLELAQGYSSTWLFDTVAVNSSRHALEYIIKTLSHKPRMIYIPYYTCEVVLEPILRLGIPYEFYHINNQLEMESPISTDCDEMIIVNNYFGIKDSYINTLLDHYSGNVIVDNAQAFYHVVHKPNRAIYSPRKFFGVPDGGYALTPDSAEFELTKDFSANRSSHLLKRLDAGAEAGYLEFQKNDSSLSNEELRAMSDLTHCLMNAINYDKIKDIRRRNFETLHSSLSRLNQLNIPDINTFECPMVYPFLTEDTDLRAKLIQSKIFVAKYWPNVSEWCDTNSVEYHLAEHLIPLPIDQRYTIADMAKIGELITTNLKIV